MYRSLYYYDDSPLLCGFNVAIKGLKAFLKELCTIIMPRLDGFRRTDVGCCKLVPALEMGACISSCVDVVYSLKGVMEVAVRRPTMGLFTRVCHGLSHIRTLNLNDNHVARGRRATCDGLR